MFFRHIWYMIKFMGNILTDIRKSSTFGLRKRPLTFMEGVSAVLDTGGSVMGNYNTDKTDNKADFHALERDWKAVGADMYHALETYGKRQPK